MVKETDLLERIYRVYSESLSKEEFVEKTNEILGTTYTINEIEWEDDEKVEKRFREL